MGISGVNSSFRVAAGKKHVETKHHWAEIRVKRDPRKGDQYIDVLIGRKGSDKVHSHLGINLNQSLRFSKPRRKITRIRREIDSKMRGRLADETLVLKPGKGQADLRLQVVIDDPTKTIEVKFKETSLTLT